MARVVVGNPFEGQIPTVSATAQAIVSNYRNIVFDADQALSIKF